MGDIRNNLASSDMLYITVWFHFTVYADDVIVQFNTSAAHVGAYCEASV